MMHADDDVTEGWADELQTQSFDNDDDDDGEDDISDSEDDASDASEDAISVVARLAVDEATDAAIRQSQSSPCASWANVDANDEDGQVSLGASSPPHQSDSEEDGEGWPDCPRPSTSLSTNQIASDQSDDDDDEAEVKSCNNTTLPFSSVPRPSAMCPALQPCAPPFSPVPRPSTLSHSHQSQAPPLTAPADCLSYVVSIVTLTDSFLSLQVPVVRKTLTYEAPGVRGHTHPPSNT